MKTRLPRDWSELAYRIRNSASAQMWIVVAVAIAFALVTSAFFGAALGSIGAFIIFIGAGGLVLSAELRRRRATPNRVKDRTSLDEANDFGAALFQERLADDDK